MGRLRPKATCFRFGPFELDAGAPELRKAGIPVRIQPQPLDVLCLLVSRAGELVSRDDIRRRIWGGNTFVDFELSLNFCLNRIRTSLGESTSASRYIETIRRRGYRFIATVEPVVTNQPTLAVLPFENLNRDPAQDFFADAVADALTTELGNVSALRVISRQSVLHFKGTQKTLPEIGHELQADAVIEGSVFQAAGGMRITAQLIQVDPEEHLWANAYKCDVGDVLTVQGQVARAIAEAVEIVLTPAEVGRLLRPRPVNPEAHAAFLKGKHHMGRWSREGFRKSLEYFQLAVDKDPAHALAHAHMAECYGLLGFWGHLPIQHAYARAKEEALQALALDEALSTAHWVRGWASWLLDWGLATNEAETLRAIQLNPSDEGAHSHYAVFLATVRGEGPRAVAEGKLALELAPLSQYVNTNVAWIYLFVKDDERAVAQAQRTLDLFPESLQAYYVIGLAELRRRRFAQAISALEKAYAICSDVISTAYLGHARAMAGETRVARFMLKELLAKSEREYITPRSIVYLYAGLGERDRAFEWLERAYRDRDASLFWLRVMPAYDPLRSDARFEDMLQRIGLTGACAAAVE